MGINKEYIIIIYLMSMLPHAGQSQGKRCTAYTLGSFCCGRFPPLWICSNVGICDPFLATGRMSASFSFCRWNTPCVFQSMSSFSLQHSGSSVPRGANFVIYSWILILSSWIMALTVILTLPLFLGYGVLGCWTLCGTVCTLSFHVVWANFDHTVLLAECAILCGTATLLAYYNCHIQCAALTSNND